MQSAFDRHRENHRTLNLARSRALRELAAIHAGQFAELYEAELIRVRGVGVNVHQARRTRKSTTAV